MTIRPARLADVTAVARLAAQLGAPASPAVISHRLAGLLASEQHAVLVATRQEDDQVVGWVHVFVAPRLSVDAFAEIGGLVVDEPLRGQELPTSTYSSGI